MNFEDRKKSWDSRAEERRKRVAAAKGGASTDDGDSTSTSTSTSTSKLSRTTTSAATTTTTTTTSTALAPPKWPKRPADDTYLDDPPAPPQAPLAGYKRPRAFIETGDGYEDQYAAPMPFATHIEPAGQSTYGNGNGNGNGTENSAAEPTSRLRSYAPPAVPVPAAGKRDGKLLLQQFRIDKR